MTNFQKINLGILNIIELYNTKYSTQIFYAEVFVGVRHQDKERYITSVPTEARITLFNLYHSINLLDTNFIPF